jgi:peptide/nickel transport system permease protein
MAYLTRRVTFYLAALIIALSINFMLPRLMPGDPVEIMFASFQGQMAPEGIESLKAAYGFVDDASMFDQYVLYIKSLLRGDLGVSISAFPSPVTDVIKQSLWWTIFLVGTATVVSYILGTLFGINAAWRRGGPTDSILLPVLSSFRAFPYFWIALLALYYFGFKLRWFPLGGAYDVSMPIDWSSWEFYKSILFYSALPLLTLIFVSLGSGMMSMRNNMIGIVTEDYVTLAKAKGLDDSRVKLTYAARNAILPTVTSFGLRLGFLISGALITEMVFSYPGMGFTLLRAVNARDYQLMQGIFLAITLSVLAINFIVDILYMFLDPRVRV